MNDSRLMLVGRKGELSQPFKILDDFYRAYSKTQWMKQVIVKVKEKFTPSIRLIRPERGSRKHAGSDLGSYLINCGQYNVPCLNEIR